MTLPWFQKESLAKAKACCPGNRLAFHPKALLREQLPMGLQLKPTGMWRL